MARAYPGDIAPWSNSRVTLTDIMIDELRKEGDGQHPTEPFIQRVYERCQQQGLLVSLQDVRREFRSVAGFP